MLASAQRLRRRDEFAAVMRSGRRAGRGGLVVHVKDLMGSENPSACARAGFIVPKAVGNAVVRNKVRRRLRHALRERLPEIGPVDIVVRVQPAAATVPYSQLIADLDAAVRAARARRNNRTGS